MMIIELRYSSIESGVGDALCASNMAFSNRFWPWSGWLVPVIRSGHTGKETKTVFLAPDTGRLAEGVAGQCWSSDAMISKENLPKIQQHTSSQNKIRYCRHANMPLWMLDDYCEEGRPVARNFLSFPVKTTTGNRWGVLVFDSRNSSGIDTEKAQEAFQIIVEPLGALLEGV